ncbi:MAG TPA: DUF4185 domain-containing protein [Candidatus Acidoferrum sp.]|nr:DUF4185 domain-containing protein [Candidatus Acidoferrum sp.]
MPQPRAAARPGLISTLLLSVTVLRAHGDPVANHASGHLPMPAKPFALPKDHPLHLVSVTKDPVYKDLLGLRTSGWLGSDVGESIVLSQAKALWLFGDTFIGRLTNGVRAPGARMINSTIALQDRAKAPPGCMSFYWKEKDGQPASFFPHQAGTPGEFYWVSKGLMLRGELFLFAWCISGDTRNFTTWHEAGSVVIRVPNPLDPPSEWVQKASTLNLPEGDTFHAALVLQEPYLYMYGVVRPRQTAIARARVADLVEGKLAAAYEYWVSGPEGPHWGKSPEHCVPQFLPVNTECTVHYEPAWSLYTCFTYDAFSPEIYLTTATKLTGPWSKPAPIYWVPEHHQFSFPIISYAVRQHPELSTRPGEVVLSYATNVPESMAQLFTEEGKDLYVHRFVRVQLELNNQLN